MTVEFKSVEASIETKMKSLLRKYGLFDDYLDFKGFVTELRVGGTGACLFSFDVTTTQIGKWQLRLAQATQRGDN